MHGLEASLEEARTIAAAVESQAPAARVALCPPSTLISRLAHALAGASVEVGGQDCRAEPQGAFTGSISAEMLTDAGATLVILGHSERRAGYGETSADVAAKTLAALRAGLEPIVCVGETEQERQEGRTLEVVLGQVRESLPDALGGCAFALAYEPIWAIGTGATPTRAEIEEVHGAMRQALQRRWPGALAPILYGGSVKPDNAQSLCCLKDIDGALVGGASLDPYSFAEIVRNAVSHS